MYLEFSSFEGSIITLTLGYDMVSMIFTNNLKDINIDEIDWYFYLHRLYFVPQLCHKYIHWCSPSQALLFYNRWHVSVTIGIIAYLPCNLINVAPGSLLNSLSDKKTFTNTCIRAVPCTSRWALKEYINIWHSSKFYARVA